MTPCAFVCAIFGCAKIEDERRRVEEQTTLHAAHDNRRYGHCLGLFSKMMKVLRRVETLCRLHGQNSWQCGAIFPLERNLSGRYPRKTSFAHESFSSPPPLMSMHGRRSFATSSNSDDLRPAVDATSTSAAVPHVLEVASSEARQVISKAPKSSTASASTTTTTTTTRSSPQSAQEAIDAAKAMMTLTSNTKLLAEAILENKANAEQVASLHQALIAVTSWCTSLVLPENVDLLQHALDLARRAHELSLPLHLPLYKSLVTAIAQYSQEETKVLTILETANLAVSALNTPFQPSFFSDALIELVNKGEIKNAVLLKKGIQTRFDVEHFDMATMLDLLGSLKEHVGHEDARELIDLMWVTIDVEIENIKEEIRRDSIADMLAEEADEDALTDDDSDDDDDEDSDNDDEPTFDFDDYDKIRSQIIALTERIESRRHSQAESIAALKRKIADLELDLMKSFDAMKRDTPEDDKSHEDGEEDSLFETDSMIRQRVKVLLRDDDDEASNVDEDDYETDELTKQMVYLRDSSSWMLPDVTLQLVELNGGRDVFYTRAYEEDVLRRVIDTNGTYY